jgi:MFS family permease
MQKGDHFSWSSEMQGIILGCYYWSFILVLVPFGYICDRYGGASLLNASILLSGILYILIPIAAETSVWLLILIRTLLGMFQAGVNASSYVLICEWMPLHERSFALALTTTIGNVSTVLFLLCTGFIVKNFDWQGMFYIPGIMSLVTFVIVAPVIRSKPESHPCIQQEEVEYIHGNSGHDQENLIPDSSEEISHIEDPCETSCPAPEHGVPWIRMFTNPAVLCLTLWKISSSISSFIITSESPSYLSQVFDMQVGEIGQISAIANALYVIGCLSFAQLSEVMIQKGLVSRTNCRKLFSIFAGTGVALTSLLSLARCNKEITVALLFANYIMQSCYVASDLTLPAEMTTKYRGVLFSVMNIASMAPGFMGPMYTGTVLQVVGDHWHAWDIILGSTACMLILANILFLFYASADVQSFDLALTPQTVHQDDPSIPSSQTANNRPEIVT